jgi:hypothetical protein
VTRREELTAGNAGILLLAFTACNIFIVGELKSAKGR